MTKTIIIGETKNSITFSSFLTTYGASPCTASSPSDFGYIELICKNYMDGHDLMFAYNDPDMRKKGVLFFGMWNDGVV